MLLMMTINAGADNDYVDDDDANDRTVMMMMLVNLIMMTTCPVHAPALNIAV